jgi:hypothetical protein
MIRLGLGPQAKPERPKSTQPSKPTTARATASSSAAEGVAAPAPVALHGVSNTGRSIVLDTSHTMDASATSILLKIQAPSRPHSTIRRQAVHVESLASHVGAGGGSTGSSVPPPRFGAGTAGSLLSLIALEQPSLSDLQAEKVHAKARRHKRKGKKKQGRSTAEATAEEAGCRAQTAEAAAKTEEEPQTGVESCQGRGGLCTEEVCVEGEQTSTLGCRCH